MVAPVTGRLAGAILAVRQAVGTACGIPLESIEPDEDLINDLGMDELECESLGLILDEVFAVVVPIELYRSPLYRTCASLAEWIIRQSEASEWTEARRHRRVG